MSRSDAAQGLRAGALVFLLAPLALALFAAAPVRAQVQSVDTSQPIAVKPASKSHRKFDTFAGQILSVDQKTIKVRGAGGYDVRSFAYTPKVSAKVARGIAKGHYAQGKPVRIKYVPGSDVASRIRR